MEPQQVVGDGMGGATTMGIDAQGGVTRFPDCALSMADADSRGFVRIPLKRMHDLDLRVNARGESTRWDQKKIIKNQNPGGGSDQYRTNEGSVSCYPKAEGFLKGSRDASSLPVTFNFTSRMF